MSEPKLEWRVVTLKAQSEYPDVRYCVLGPDGAVDFHVSRSTPNDPIAGLECHYRSCPTYMRNKEPFSETCWLTGARCWGDGTTLYAMERLLPLLESLPTELFFRVLEDEYRKRFNPREIAFVADEATADV
jgi:hypothetical protein